MRFLLDTHAFLYFIEGDFRLPLAVRDFIADPENEILLSVASIWEMSVKLNAGKLTLRQPLPDLLQQHADAGGFTTLPVERPHAEHVAALPLRHHDPFDRLLVAQAFVERVPLISGNTALDAYGISRIW